MGKKWYPDSLIAAYSCSRKRLSTAFPFLAVGILFILVVVVFFWPEKPVVHKEFMQDTTEDVDHDLVRNIQWLNHRAQIVKVVAKPQAHTTITPIQQSKAYHVTPLNNKRLEANSLVFSQSHTTSSTHQADHVLNLSRYDRRLMAGEVLHAVLESAIQSDFAGPVRAILSDPSYSYRGMRLLLPAGTRLIGQYKNMVTASQVRVGIQWQRMILPDGKSVVFEAPGMGPMGRIGVRASRVNSHFWKRFGEASLYSLLSAGSQLSGGLSADTLTAGQLLRSQVAGSFADTAMQSLDKNKQIAPTIYLDPGSEVSIFVRRDIEF